MTLYTVTYRNADGRSYVFGEPTSVHASMEARDAGLYTQEEAQAILEVLAERRLNASEEAYDYAPHNAAMREASLAQVKLCLRMIGVAVGYVDGEWRITLPAAVEPDAARREAVAYYTDCDHDAIDTARRMLDAEACRHYPNLIDG